MGATEGHTSASPVRADAVSSARPRLRLSLAPPTLDRYIGRMIMTPVATIMAVLCLLMLLERALVLLAEMAALGMAPGYFPWLMAELVPYYLTQAIPAAFVAALVLVIGRMAGDHEWEVMAAAGMSPARLARPMTLVAFGLACLTLVVAGWLEPVGRYGYRSMRAIAISESQLRAFQPQVIYQPSDDAMLTVDAIDADGGNASGLFLWLEEDEQRQTVAAARAGNITTRRSPSALDFQMTDGVLITDDRFEARFSDLSGSHPLGGTALARARGRDARELTLSELVAQDPAELVPKSRDQRASEIYGRIARSFSILVMPWIVLPLLLAGPRQPQRWPAVALIVALVVTFYHGVNFGRNLVASGGVGVLEATALTVAAPLLAAALVWRFGSRLAGFAPTLRLPFVRARRTVERPSRGLAGYLTARLTLMTGTVVVCLVLMLQLVDLFDHGETLVSAGAGLAGFARYAWYRLPATLLQAMPIAMLGGALLVWARMRLTSELVAIKAAGISTFGILGRALVVPVAAGFTMLAVAEFWSPPAQVELTEWWQRLAPGSDADDAVETRWFRMGDDIVRASLTAEDGSALSGVDIYRRDANGALVERITATGATYEAGVWRLSGATVWRAEAESAGASPLANPLWHTALTPVEVRQFYAAPVPLSGRSALAAVRNDAVPIDKAPALYETRFLMTFTIAVAPLVMLLLTVALIVAPSQDKSLAFGLFQCLTAGLSFLVMNGYCEVMGQAGALAPVLAVLAAPVTFAWLGIDRILKADGAC